MAVATTNAVQLLHDDDVRRASWAALAGVAFALVVAFSYIGHSLAASKDFAEHSLLNPNRLENRFAVRLRSTQTNSVIGFNIMGAVGAWCWLTADRRLLRVNAALALLGAAFVGWCFASILWSIHAPLSLRKEGILALMMIAALGMAARFELEDLLWIAITVLATFVCVGVLAELYHGTLRPWRSLYRFTGTLDANDQGLQCALLALAALCARGPGLVDRPWLRGGLMALGVSGLWLSKSRTTLAAFVVASMLAVVLGARGTRRWMVLGACLMVACAGGIAYSFLSVSVIGETAEVAAMGREKDINTLTGRLPLWQEAWAAAKQRPWVGHGFGAYWNAKTVLEYSDQFEWHIPHAHNTYIDLTLAIGGVGLAFYVLWVASSSAVALVRYERSGRTAQLFVACFLLMTLVHGATESKIPGAGPAALMQLIVMASLILMPPRQPRAAASIAGAGRKPMVRPRPHVPPRFAQRWEGSV